MRFASCHRVCWIFITILILLPVLAAACSGGETSLPTSVPTPITPTAVPVTPTPTTPPGKVILVANPDTPADWMQSGQALLTELAGTSGMVFETRQTLQAGEIGPDWKIVVLLSPLPNLPELLSVAPQVQFLVLSPVDLGAGANLSIIRMRPEFQAFLAGYVVTVIAADWRGGGLLPSDTQLGPLLMDAFANGGHYFCGTCNTYYAPFAKFPVSAFLPAGSGLPAWQSTADQLLQNVVYTMYVAPEISSRELLYYLGSKGLILVGSQTPPGEVLNLWAVTVRLDGIAPIRTLWADLVAGKGGKQVNSSLVLTDINPSLLTPARQRLVDETLQLLINGKIYPFTVQ